MAELLMVRTALGGRADEELRTHGGTAMVMLSELPASTMLDVRLDPADVATLAAVQKAAGLDLPQTPGQFSAHAERSALWFGPDQWLILAPAGEAGALMRALNAVAGSTVDVSDLRAEFELAGPLAADVLRKGCGIDLHPRVFGPGNCALTSLARVRVALRQTDERPGYRLLVERSVALYLWDWLVDAMKEFTGG